MNRRRWFWRLSDVLPHAQCEVSQARAARNAAAISDGDMLAAISWRCWQIGVHVATKGLTLARVWTSAACHRSIERGEQEDAKRAERSKDVRRDHARLIGFICLLAPLLSASSASSCSVPAIFVAIMGGA